MPVGSSKCFNGSGRKRNCLVESDNQKSWITMTRFFLSTPPSQEFYYTFDTSECFWSLKKMRVISLHFTFLLHLSSQACYSKNAHMDLSCLSQKYPFICHTVSLCSCSQFKTTIEFSSRSSLALGLQRGCEYNEDIPENKREKCNLHNDGRTIIIPRIAPNTSILIQTHQEFWDC